MSRDVEHAEAVAAASAQFLAELRQELAGTRLGVVIKGAEVRSFKAGASSGLSFSPGRLMGWSLRETSGAGSATVYVRDGRDNQADIIAVIQLQPSESARDWFAPGGISYQWGIFLDVASGAIEGAVYVNGSGD